MTATARVQQYLRDWFTAEAGSTDPDQWEDNHRYTRYVALLQGARVTIESDRSVAVELDPDGEYDWVWFFALDDAVRDAPQKAPDLPPGMSLTEQSATRYILNW